MAGLGNQIFEETMKKIVQEYNERFENSIQVLSNPHYDLYDDWKKEIEDYFNKQKKNEKNGISFKEEKPMSLAEFFEENNVPKKKIIMEKFNNSLKEERIKLEEKFTKKYNNEYLKTIDDRNKKNKEKFEKDIKKENLEIVKFNKNIDDNLRRFYQGDKKLVEEVLRNLFDNKIRLKIDEVSNVIKIDFDYEPKSKLLSLNMIFMTPSLFSKIPKSASYVRGSESTKITYATESECEACYEGYLTKTSLYVVYEISKHFEDLVDCCYINSFIDDINPKTGKKDNILVLSSNIETSVAKDIVIDNVNAKEFFIYNKARISKNMITLSNIEPLRIGKKLGKNDLDIDNINYNIDGFEFEKLSKDLLLSQGFDYVEVTKASGDYGADVIAYKDDIKYAIQCKKYTSKVGVSAVQEVIASKSIYKCHVAAVLTNNYFTPSAIKLANENNVLLWDGDKLKMMIEDFNKLSASH